MNKEFPDIPIGLGRVDLSDPEQVAQARPLNKAMEAKHAVQAMQKPGPAEALYAFMGWLTSRDEVSGPFSARHDAAQAAQLVKTFCEAQGWAIDEPRYLDVIRELKHKYPR